MKNFLGIAVFATVVSFFYTGVAQVLPQLENHPPPEVRAGVEIGPDKLIEAGVGVFNANCVQCHKLGEKARGPDLASVGARMASRAAERAAVTGRPYTDVDFLLESLCKPGDYLVQGFGNIMPPQQKVLSGGQVLAVVAFLQSLGGDATVRGTETAALEKFGCGGAAGPAVAAAAAPVGKPEEVFTTFGCATCHTITSDERRLGPSLKGAGKRLGKGVLYESILAPNAAVTVGTPPYPAGLMLQTLSGNGFYERMQPNDYQALVDWLAQH